VSAYTTLRVTEAGVVLFDAHRARLGPDAFLEFDAFAAGATPGVYVLQRVDGRLQVTPRPGSRLFEGIPLRRQPSPLAPGLGPQAKAGAPGPYDAVRVAGVATLLTDPSGDEVWESCTAAVLAWDGQGLVAVPEDRTRVASTAEQELVRCLPVRRAPVRPEAGWPLVLVNAVICCVPKGSAFPAPQRALFDEVLAASARRRPA
jgi:hypothetical protein